MSAVLPPSGPLLGFPFNNQAIESPGAASPVTIAATPQLSPNIRFGQKRKLCQDDDSDEEMVGSPDASPLFGARSLVASPHVGINFNHQSLAMHGFQPKRARTEIIGRRLPLSRQLEFLDVRTLKMLICNLAEKHPYLTEEISHMAPTPNVSSSLDLLSKHLDRIESAFPYKGDQTGDYAYLRVRPHITEFLDAVSDYTPNFLPPEEQQAGNSLQFLDGVTSLVHKLPSWRTESNNSMKHTAYDELARAWSLAVREALKRANGIVLEYGGWREKLAKHNEMAEGRLQSAVDVIEEGLGNHGRRFNRFF
ncbi:Cut8 six-helix bundle-domain-containing protein [Dipodascopsis uninucleata]